MIDLRDATELVVTEFKAKRKKNYKQFLMSNNTFINPKSEASNNNKKTELRSNRKKHINFQRL